MTTLLMPVRSDTLPEHSTYRDDGCEIHRSCLDCPLPMCKYDDPGWIQRESRRSRDEAIIRARHEEEAPVPSIASRFGVSTRTVHRVLQTGGATRTVEEPEDEGPRFTVLELDKRSLFRRRMPFPPIEARLISERKSA